VNNLEYGSYAPDAPQGIFITDRDLPALWARADRYYLVADDHQTLRLRTLLGNALTPVKTSGGKNLFTNH
jgi:hypothetical protein